MSNQQNDRVIINVEGTDRATGNRIPVKREVTLDQLNINGGETEDPTAKMMEILADDSLSESEKMLQVEQCSREAALREIDANNTPGRIMTGIKQMLETEGIDVNTDDLTMTMDQSDQGATTYNIMPQAAWGFGLAA